MAEDEAARRQQEINLFAAMAQADDSTFSTGTFDSDALKAAPAPAPDAATQDRNMFAQAASFVDSSGTFDFKKEPKKDKKAASTSGGNFVKNYNLEAAAAALDLDEMQGSNKNVVESTFTPNRNRFFSADNGALQAPPPPTQTSTKELPKAAPRTPMHAQRVYLHKPLFFGHTLPPRVVNEAKAILQRQPTDKPFAPEVRNMLSVIRTYGHGLDLLKEDAQPTPYVSVFCPKWSEPFAPDEDPSLWVEIPPPLEASNSEESFGSIVGVPSDLDQLLEGEPIGKKDATGSVSTNATQSLTVDTSTNINDRDLFSMWARGGDDAGTDTSPNSSLHDRTANARPAVLKRNSSVESFNSAASSGTPPNRLRRDSSTGSADPVALSERDLFSQWARGESPRDTEVSRRSLLGANASSSSSFQVTANSSTTNTRASISGESFSNQESTNGGSTNFFNASGTFLNVPGVGEADDDDEVVVSELKKKVGMNEHLNAALAFFEDFGDSTTSEQRGNRLAVEDADDVSNLAQVPLTPDGGRPLTNHELMNGVSPLFGCDDSSLPTEADLGIHETKDEQQRSNEQRRNQAIIEDVCPQNIFGPLACPNPALDPDDNHSWNSRVAPVQPRTGAMSNPRSNDVPKTISSPGVGVLPSPGGSRLAQTPLRSNMSPPRSPMPRNDSASVASASVAKSKQATSRGKRFDVRSRFGWWNVREDGTEVTPRTIQPGTDNSSSVSLDVMALDADQPPLQLPPASHPATNNLIRTKLEPQPEQLQEQNRPLSELHPATTMARTIPFLSDRPPSYRYLQIDTQAVGFPTLGGEIEPLFCSLAIYNVETAPHASGADPSMAPIPELSRCSRVTEILTFDVVSEPKVEERCNGSLWPIPGSQTDSDLQGTRCGVFPLPSNLNMASLYAVLIVHKVVAEASDFDVYLKSATAGGTNAGKKEKIDLEALRTRAEKSATSQGKFIMPFAFGVAPLLQVFGGDVPTVPSSRAVQIPLFRFTAGKGDRQIIDHIMVMLYPRADHRLSGIGGPAPVTNGGTAMLVMRNFGYLGLHSVVNSKSSLARDRLVDFTREVQLRRREADEDEDKEEEKSSGKNPDVLWTGEWHKAFVAEPTKYGGRYTRKTQGTGKSESPLYAQEMAPIRLNPSETRVATKTPRGRSHYSQGEDIEPYFRTSFCNELLCHPRHLQNCPTGNIVVKVELRDLVWVPEYGAYLSNLPVQGPAVHNPRRGPVLVQSAFTSCSAKCQNPVFLDEFKVRLPLLLSENGINESTGRNTALVFTVYRLSFSNRKRWGKMFRTKKTGTKVDEITSGLAGETPQDDSAGQNYHLIQLACGFLPLSATNSSGIVNGNHEVKMVYQARVPKNECIGTGDIRNSTVFLCETLQSADGKSDQDDVALDDNESMSSSHHFTETASAASASESVALSEQSTRSRSRGKSMLSAMVLQNDAYKHKTCLKVRVSVFSSVHCQNSVLGEFLGQEPISPMPLDFAPCGLEDSTESSGIRQVMLELADEPKAPENAYDNERLLTSTIDISKVSMCPLPDVAENLLRVVNQLWKVVVFGLGESDIQWANPAACLPLRVQAFATLLHLLASSTAYLGQKGLAQLDGSSKWSQVTASRLFALSFDEEFLFGDMAHEPQYNLFKKTGKQNPLTPPGNGFGTFDRRAKRHQRSNFEFNHNGTTTSYAADDDQLLQKSDQKEVEDIDIGDLQPAEAVEPEDKSDPAPASLKVDSVTDFRSALKAGSLEVEKDDPLYDNQSQSRGARTAMAMVQAYSGLQGSKRWGTAPGLHLATIREDGDTDNEADGSLTPTVVSRRKPAGPLDALDTELFVNPAKNTVKQMRVPQTRRGKKANPTGTSLASIADELEEDSLGPLQSPTSGTVFEGDPNQLLSVLNFDSPASSPSKDPNISRPPPLRQRSQTLPVTDAEIESAGTSFLDAIEKSLGFGPGKRASTSEESRVGQSHHRKTRSSCSIDWSIPNDDFGPPGGDIQSSKGSASDQESPHQDFEDHMSALDSEVEVSARLPSYLDRLIAVRSGTNASGRWFPFVYEIVLLQWASMLREQRNSDRNSDDSPNFYDKDHPMADAASRTVGVAVACAPILFEVFKQSLGWRVASLVAVGAEGDKLPKFTPLVSLDETLMTSFEEIIATITEMCLHSRNFDSWQTRQTCIDVNDAIVRTIRDMYAFLAPSCVFRLTTVYLSRLVGANKKYQDRDSAIGLRCSWEVTKMQMDAISTFVRFPDFVKVNSPHFGTIGELKPHQNARMFYDDLLTFYCSLNPRALDEAYGSSPNKMKPHWLAEIVVDFCLLGIEHVEQNFQRRASSTLHELFWRQSQQSLKEGNTANVAAMFFTMLEKTLPRTNYLATCFSPKSQVRLDVLRCVVFTLQSAPTSLLRAFWRKLFEKAAGRNFSEKHGGVGYTVFMESSDDLQPEGQRKFPKPSTDRANSTPDYDIFDMFSLLNLCLATLEYEGNDFLAETSEDDERSYSAMWKGEYLVVKGVEMPVVAKRRRLLAAYGSHHTKTSPSTVEESSYGTAGSRRWHSHDSAIIAIRTAQQIVRELRYVLEPSDEAHVLFNPARRKAIKKKVAPKPPDAKSGGTQVGNVHFTYTDTVMFVRAATSVYLHALALRSSDIVVVRTLTASVEIVKIFGIKIFNEAVGETLQHWLRVVTFHCGSRRADVRVQASDFLELVLRSTWDAFGSFFRIRLPLLAVQTEVIERIVATASTRHYREQRMIGMGIDFFSNGSAEASLAPLWRTLDRLHHQSASQNVAFRGALVQLAEKLKKLFRAYVAAHALNFLNKAKSPGLTGVSDAPASEESPEIQTLIRATRISIHRVVNASAGYSKQFLGFNSTSLEHCTVAHNEAVEDAFLAAADVFSPTELPDHRVAWLRRLAGFHASRSNFAEEATCHYNIHVTMQHASMLHGSLWSSTPFLPWTNSSDSIHLDGEGPAGVTDDVYEFDDTYNGNSFRRIFYRNENSIRIGGGELQQGASKYVFCGVTVPSEYTTVVPWTGLEHLQEHMLDEAESAADLFLKAGIVASSCFTRSLAVRHYATMFNYGKLGNAYKQLARSVVTQVPPLDTSIQEVCVTVPLGRFYRVWFHGGAPDELIGAEFVYRTASNVKLEQFGQELKEVIRCIIPDKTPIHLVLDGRPEEREEQRFAGFRMGAHLEPVRVKVTPLRSIFSNNVRMRGLPDWFKSYIEATSPETISGHKARQSSSPYPETTNNVPAKRPTHREHGPSYASVFSSSTVSHITNKNVEQGGGSRRYIQESPDGELVGADKFSFMQPITKGRGRARDWLRGSSGDFAEKSLRITQLQVRHAFPACVSRQAVIHRVVFTQSPLEAAFDSVCQWCSVLYRTAIAYNGQVVLGIKADPGIGIDAAKAVGDCMHSSRVKEMGLYLLRKNSTFEEEDDDGLQSFDRLSEDEVTKMQLKLARALIVFIQLLHLLISRNRDLLLTVIQERKRSEGGSSRHGHSVSLSRGDFSFSDGKSTRSHFSRQGSMGANESTDGRTKDDMSIRSFQLRKGSMSHTQSVPDDSSVMSGATMDKARTDAAIGIQSELQRAFISMAKELHPMFVGVLGRSTPSWLKACTFENYFSSYQYREANFPLTKEIFFEDDDVMEDSPSFVAALGVATRSNSSVDGIGFLPQRATPGIRVPNSPSGSIGSSSSVSRGSEAGISQISGKRSHKSHDASMKASI
eukprot:Nitzschia sp. Nitz4//scaffold22_size323478//75040//86490//NITZ4_000513-RA/size323478-snap-gene-0.540-mRNA-1//-1//CDS//3329542953//7733//frame0